MTGDDTDIVRSFEELGKQQLEIYAAELQQHYREERQLRRELQERNNELELKVNELLALNRLVQKVLDQYLEGAGPQAAGGRLNEWFDGPSAQDDQTDANGSNV